MEAEGIPIAVQNEPLNPKNTPSMVMFAQEQDGFLKDHLVGDIISNDEDKRSDSLSPAILLFWAHFRATATRVPAANSRSRRTTVKLSNT
jgi:hypothetical protein